ncbi:MAG: DedA family protein [Methermicoccaceae archaeon]
MFEGIVALILGIVGGGSYPGIFLLMCLESTFFPFPSEVVMIPAGYLSSQGELDPWLCILAGTFGSVSGAIINYTIARKLGRPFLEKHSHLFLLTPKHFRWADTLFERHGEIITLLGRLLPGVRQYISFPPGLANMNAVKFFLFTLIGAGAWVSVLVYIGYNIGVNGELVREYLSTLTYYLIAFVVVVGALYWVFRYVTGKQQAEQEVEKQQVGQREGDRTK